MLARVVGIALCWVLGALAVFFTAAAIDGLVRLGSSYSGNIPFLFGLAAITGIPCIFIWRFMIR